MAYVTWFCISLNPSPEKPVSAENSWNYILWRLSFIGFLSFQNSLGGQQLLLGIVCLFASAFMSQGLTHPRLVSDSLCSRGSPWPSGSSYFSLPSARITGRRHHALPISWVLWMSIAVVAPQRVPLGHWIVYDSRREHFNLPKCFLICEHGGI